MKLKELVELYFKDEYRDGFISMMTLSEVFYNQLAKECGELNLNCIEMQLDFGRTVTVMHGEWNSPDFEEFMLDWLKLK